jgi:hypothetical protein
MEALVTQSTRAGPPSWRVIYPELRAQRPSPETLKDLSLRVVAGASIVAGQTAIYPWPSFQGTGQRQTRRSLNYPPHGTRCSVVFKPPRRGSPNSTRNSNNSALKPGRSPGRAGGFHSGACSAAVANFAHIAALAAPVRINRLVHTVSVTLDPHLTYGYPCPTGFSACHYIYPTTAFFFLYAMALSCL